MLRAYKLPPDEFAEGVPAHQTSPAELFFTAVGFVRRQFLVVLSVLPLAIGLAAVYLYVTPPLYQGVARVLIDPSKVQVFKESILEAPADYAMMDSQIEILKSENFARSIINKLNLTRDPEFVSSNGVISRVLRAPNRILRRVLHKPVSDPDIMLNVVDQFEKRLTAFRVGVSYVIEIEFLSTDPNRAAQIANAVADGFIVDQMESKFETIGKATAWLQERLNDLRTQASAAERAVVEYKSKHDIVVDSGGHLINEQQLTDLNTALVKAREDRAEAQARLDRVLQVIKSGDVDPADTEIATVAEALHSDVVNKLRGQYLELAQREALLTARVGSDHLAVVSIRNQMHEIRRSTFDELKRIAEATKSDYDIAVARENSVRQNMAAAVAGSQTTNHAQIELRQLESAAQSYRALYDNFQQRYMDFVQEQSFPASGARVITRAWPALQKTSPKSFKILLLATLGGLVVGLGLAVLREISDWVFRTRKQVETRLNIDCVAVVPTVKYAAKLQTTEQAAASAVPRTIALNAGSGLLRHVLDTPLSAFAESIRAVKVSADLSAAIKSNRVIGITSSLPDEGKSTIAASLAQLSAHSGARVILVDCDLRKPSLSEQLVPNAPPGLLDVLTNVASLDKLIWSDPSSKLSFLPAGVKSRLFHPNEILASNSMRQLFDRLGENYEYVIVDLPPMIPVVDVRASTHLFDAYVFIIEWGKTKIDVAEHALNSARGVYDKLVGVVLNKADLKKLGRYEGHGDYYYGLHYGKYGYAD